MNAFNKLVGMAITGTQAVLVGFAYLQVLLFALLVFAVIAVLLT